MLTQHHLDLTEHRAKLYATGENMNNTTILNPNQSFTKKSDYYPMQRYGRKKQIYDFLINFFPALADRQSNDFYDFHHRKNPKTIKKIIAETIDVSEKAVVKVLSLMVREGLIEMPTPFRVRVNAILGNKQGKFMSGRGYFRANIIKGNCAIVVRIMALEQKKRRIKEDPELNKALKIISTLTATNAMLVENNKGFAQAFKNLTEKEIEALPPALKLVALNGELVKV